FDDPLIRDLLQIPPQVNRELVRTWLARLSPDNVNTFCNVVWQWHFETAATEGHTYTLASIPQKGAPVLVLSDHARGLWLLAGRSQKHAGAIEEVLRGLPCPAKLLCHKSLAEYERKCFPDTQVELTPDPPSPPVAPDLNYLALPREFGRC